MNYEYLKGVLFIELNGMLCNGYLSEWYNYLIPLVKKHNIKELVLLTSNIYSIDDIGITAIKNLFNYMNDNNGKLYLYGNNVLLDHLIK